MLLSYPCKNQKFLSLFSQKRDTDPLKVVRKQIFERATQIENVENEISILEKSRNITLEKISNLDINLSKIRKKLSLLATQNDEIQSKSDQVIDLESEILFFKKIWGFKIHRLTNIECVLIFLDIIYLKIEWNPKQNNKIINIKIGKHPNPYYKDHLSPGFIHFMMSISYQQNGPFFI